MFTPYKWQEEDLQALRENNYTGMVAIETGGGKTPLACMVIKELQPKVTLIVAPDSTLRRPNKGWPAELQKIAGVQMRKIGNQREADKDALFDFEWGVPGVYACSTQFFARKSTRTEIWQGDLLVVDEVHKLATARTAGQRTLSGWSKRRDNPINMRFTHRLALSGSPMRQNFQNFWSTMRFLWPWNDGPGAVADANYFAWCADRMDYEEVITGSEWRRITPKENVPEDARKKKIGGEWHYLYLEKAKNFLTESEPGRLITEMPCVIQHKRRERCCDYHPHGFLSTKAPTVVEREVVLTPKQKKAIRDLEEHYMTWLDENPLVADITITQKQRIRQICLGEPRVEFWYDEEEKEHTTLHFDPDCASPFMDELLTILNEEVPEEPVVVFLEAQKFAEVITHRLGQAGISCAEYSGKRKPDLDKFGSEYRVLVAVVSSIGTGTDGLQDVCNTEVWMEVPVSLTNEHQAQSRLDRMGGRQVLRYQIMDDEGVSEGRLQNNLEKALVLRRSMRKRGE